MNDDTSDAPPPPPPELTKVPHPGRQKPPEYPWSADLLPAPERGFVAAKFEAVRARQDLDDRRRQLARWLDYREETAEHASWNDLLEEVRYLRRAAEAREQLAFLETRAAERHKCGEARALRAKQDATKTVS